MQPLPQSQSAKVVRRKLPPSPITELQYPTPIHQSSKFDQMQHQIDIQSPKIVENQTIDSKNTHKHSL